MINHFNIIDILFLYYISSVYEKTERKIYHDESSAYPPQYSYRLDHKTGFSPHVKYGLCSLSG